MLTESGVTEVIGQPSGGLGSVVEDERVRKGLNALAAVLGFYFVLQLLWPAPIGVLLQGVVIGGLTAMIAFGIALIYRSNRIINFAQGDLGGAPAALGVILILGPGVPYLVAFPVAIVAGITLGALVEFIFIRRFAKAPRLILTVVTIGVSTILAGLTFALPAIFDVSSPGQSFPSPMGINFNVGSTVFRGNEVLAMIAIPFVIAALGAFFRYTNVGIAVRASAESADRAALRGVPVKRTQTIVWVVASVLATTGIFLRAGIIGLPIGSSLGAIVMVPALTAAIIGRMVNLPTIFVASLALGVLEASILFSTSRGVFVPPILFLVVLVALLLQRRGQQSRDDDQTSSWQAARDIRVIPRELVNLPEVRWGRIGGMAALVAFLLLLPLILSIGQINLAAVIAILAIVGISLVVLTGWAGQVSLGQMGFFAIGAAVAGYLTSTRGWDLSLAVIVAGLAGAVAALLIGLPALRIRGLFLAVITLSFALAVSIYGLNPEFVTWLPQGRISRPPLFGRIVIDSEARFYYLTLAALFLTIVMARGIRRSRTGRVLIGVRENPRAAQSFGINATSAKLTAFAVSGFMAAFAGGIFVHHQQGLGISAYSIDRSFEVFVMVVIGGLGTIPGALLGTVFIQGTQYFANVFPEVLRPYLTFITGGIGLVIVLLIIPGGFSQVFYDLRDRMLRKVAERRGIIVPSLLADSRQLPPGFAEPGHETGAPVVPTDVAHELEEALVVSASGHGSGTAPVTDPTVLLEDDPPDEPRRRRPVGTGGRKS
ncbi:MAG TPA: ABC transporter permease [Acidimicrobiales bacterium]|nr:ABC transporter permease [Acidimicrobiales bacterium]